jgi:hypothetical protein
MIARLVVAAVLLFCALSAHSGEAQKNACGIAAMTDYNRAKLALLQKGSPLMSVDGAIAERRLEEEFCLRFVRCILDDSNSLQFKSGFLTCLRDEALEKYDAVARDKD